MKICAISDLHGRFIRNIEKSDVLVIAGDINYTMGVEWFGRCFIPYLNGIKDRYGLCILVFGNHDDDIYYDNDKYKKYLPPWIKVLNNESIIYKGYKFYGSPHCRYIQGFRNTVTEQSLMHIFSLIPNDTDILVTHSPPYGIGDISKDTLHPLDTLMHLGSVSLLEKVREVKPLIHIFGHIHTGNRYTRENGVDFYNVSILDDYYDLAFKPTYIELPDR